jgi:hypothetical protein
LEEFENRSYGAQTIQFFVSLLDSGTTKNNFQVGGVSTNIASAG